MKAGWLTPKIEVSNYFIFDSMIVPRSYYPITVLSKYISNSSGNKVCIIDTRTKNVEQRFLVDSGPQDLGYDKAHKRMYVGIWGTTNNPGNTIDVIDI